MSIEDQLERRRHPHNYDEVDFMELFAKIWRGKFIILSIVIVSAVVAILYLRSMPSYYRIEATVDAVRSEQLRPLRPVTLESKAYQVSVSSSVAGNLPIFDGKEYQASPPDEKKIYDKILLQIGSFNIFKNFWESKIKKVLDLSVDAKETDEAREFKRLFKSFELIAVNPKVPEVTARKVAVEYEDPKEGMKILNEYLEYVNSRVLLDQIGIIEATYLENLKSLTASYESRNSIEQNKLNDEIVQLRENLKIAESLNIKETPYKELENIQLKILDSRDYLLGTKTLSQQLEILLARQGKSLAPFVSDLRSMEIWKEQMTADLQRIKSLKNGVNLFAVVNSAEASLDPVKPKKLLMLIAVIFSSGLLGVFVVLIKSTLESRKKLSEK